LVLAKVLERIVSGNADGGKGGLVLAGAQMHRSDGAFGAHQPIPQGARAHTEAGDATHTGNDHAMSQWITPLPARLLEVPGRPSGAGPHRALPQWF
jgi:hypothetical protein